MKKTLFVILLLSASLVTKAQSNDYLLSKFGIAGGFETFYFNFNFNEINGSLKSISLPELNSGVLTYGGGAYSYIMFIRNVRFGAVGFGGSESVSSFSNGYYKATDFHIGGGALTVEYTLPQIRAIQLSVGAMLGYGNVRVDLHSHKATVAWNDIWSDFNSSSSSKSSNISSSFFLFSPTLNTEILLSRFVALRLGLGYQLAIGEKWQAYEGVDLENVPQSINSQSFFINVGILVGLFVL